MPKTAEQPQPKPRPKGVFPHTFTEEERRAGALARAQKVRDKKAAAERLVLERIADNAEPLIAKQIELALQAESENVQHAATNSALDRLLGRPTQGVEHSGNPDRPMVVEHREKLSLRDGLERVAGRRGMDAPDSAQASNTRNSPDGLA